MNETTVHEHLRDEPLDLSALDAGWGAVRALRSRRRKQRRLQWLGGTVVLVGATVAAAVVSLRTDGGTHPQLLVSGGGAETTLADGSRVALAPGAELLIRAQGPRDVQLELLRGEARFDVPHADGRQFVIVAASTEVRVRGTRFTVAVDDKTGQVRVSVDDGVVVARLRSAGARTDKVEAGQTWQWPEAPDNEVAKPESKAQPKPDANTPSRAATPRTVLPSPQRSVEHGESPVPVAVLSADDLFADARQAARAGRFREAVDLYSRLIRDYPTDGRTAVTAFEVGRILQDRLYDFSAAAVAYDEALRLNADAPFREDLVVRQVEVADASGQRAACRRWQARYREDYPNGAYLALVEKSCR